MALTMDNIFGSNEDELKPRWQQSSSKTISVIGLVKEDETLYTVTSGKTFYVTSVLYTSTETAVGSVILKDGGSGGTSLIFLNTYLQNKQYIMESSTPLKFTTNVYMTSGSKINITLVGWEE